MRIIHTGIYLIQNRINNKLYIGSSKNIKQRWKNHKQQLKSKIHCNILLQNAINKYGLESFDFKIIEECQISELIQREKDWVTFFDSINLEKGYNIMIPGEYPINNTKTKASKRQKAIDQGQQIELIDINTLKLVDTLPLLIDICTKYNLNKKKTSEVLNNKRTSYKGYIIQRQDKPKDLKSVQAKHRKFNNNETIRTLGPPKLDRQTYLKEYGKKYRLEQKLKSTKNLIHSQMSKFIDTIT